MSETSSVKSLKKASAIIIALDELDGARVTELSRHLDIPKSSIHDYVSSLRQSKLVVKNGDTYHLGLKFLYYGGRVRSKMELHQIAQPEIEQLAETTDERINLVVKEYGECVYLDIAKGENAVQLDTYIGKRTEMHNTAAGKSILANLPLERIDEIIGEHGLPQSTKNSITERDELLSELEQIREQGYALDDEERLEGLRCVAAPIMNDEGMPLGSVSISGPTTRLIGDRFQTELPELVRRTVNVIEINATYG